MENIPQFMLSISYAAVLAIIGYFLRSVHIEVKQFIKELTDYTSKLKQLIVGIQTQIDKGIETDITEIKDDIKTLYRRTNRDAQLMDNN